MKKYVDYLCLYMLLAVCCVACQEEEDASAVRSGFLISLVEEPQVGVEARAVVEVDGHSFNASHLTVTNKDNGRTAYGGEFTKEQIPAPAGTYDIEVALGEDIELGLNTPYYTGKTVETITEGIKTVSVECSLANALLSVKFGKDAEATARFAKFFSDYKVKVACGSSYVLIGENEQVYFKAGSSLTLTFKGTLKESGKDYEYIIPTENISVEAKDHTILTLAVAPVEAGVAVEVTKAEVTKETISSTIPMSWLPKPTVSAAGFDETNSLSVVETETASASLDFKLPSALQDMKFKFHFEDPQFAFLNDKEYSLVDNKTEIETALGITLPTVGEADASKAQVVLDGLISKLQTNAGVMTNNMLSVSIQTNNRWSDEATYNLVCEKPLFKVSVYPGNIWTKEFTVNALMENQVETGNYEKLSGDMTYQYSADQTTWNNMTDLTATGLEPGTKYYVRGMYRGEVPGNVMEMETYPIIALENSGFEEFSISKGNDNKLATDYGALYVWPSWATLNELTCEYAVGAARSFNSRSGTRPSNDVPSNSLGQNSVWICTIGYGYGGTSYKKVSPGELFLGVYNTKGIEYNSHPTGVSFYYKYSPFKNDKTDIYVQILGDDDVLLGEGTLWEANEVQDFIKYTMEIKYDDSHLQSSPRKLILVFKSGSNEEVELRGKAGVLTIYEGAAYRGSELYIDDVELIYDK